MHEVRERFGRQVCYLLVCYTVVFSVVTQRSSPQTATENRTTLTIPVFLSLCSCGLTNKPTMYKTTLKTAV